MQLVINLTSGSLPTYKLKLHGHGSVGACGNHWPRTDLYRGLQTLFFFFFCKNRERDLIHIYLWYMLLCNFYYELVGSLVIFWTLTPPLTTPLPHPAPRPVSVTSPYCYQYELNDTRHCHLLRSIIIPRWTCQKSTVGLKKKKVFVFWWKVLLLKNMCRLSHVQCIG